MTSVWLPTGTPRTANRPAGLETAPTSVPSTRTVTPESATGLGDLGKVRLLDPPSMTENFVQREMGYTIARKNAQKLRCLSFEGRLSFVDCCDLAWHLPLQLINSLGHV
mgnify:CR=1 FL=1